MGAADGSVMGAGRVALTGEDDTAARLGETWESERSGGTAEGDEERDDTLAAREEVSANEGRPMSCANSRRCGKPRSREKVASPGATTNVRTAVQPLPKQRASSRHPSALTGRGPMTPCS